MTARLLGCPGLRGYELKFGGKKLGLGHVDCQAGLAQALKNFLQVSAVFLLGP